MEKEKYLYLILDEFYNAKKLREDYINQKEFYKKINGNNDVIRNLDNNINLFNKTIEYLENLIYLPIHEMIKNMSNNELLNYKKDILSKENNVIFKEQNKIEELKKEIKELNIDIENISYNYSKYKREKVLDEKQLDFYVSDCKEKLQEIEEINNEIKEIECNMSNMLSKKNTLETLTLEEFRKYLIDYYGINNIELELDKYKVNRTDEIVVDLCSDLNILDSVKELINKYISLRDKSIKKTIKMPKEFNDYKVENKTYLNDFILTSCFHSSYDKSTNEIDILNEKDMYVMKEKVDAVISEIDKSKNNLIDFKLK